MFSTAMHLNSTFLSDDCFFTPLKQVMRQCSPKNFRELKYPTQCQLKSPKINRSYMLTVLFPGSVVIKKNQNTIIVQKNEWNANVIVTADTSHLRCRIRFLFASRLKKPNTRMGEFLGLKSCHPMTWGTWGSGAVNFLMH